MSVNKIDPIRDRYFEPLRRVEAVNEWLFLIGAVLTLAAYLIDGRQHEVLSRLANGGLIAVVIALFVSGLVCRLHLQPRAEAQRRNDFLTKAFGVSLTHETTSGYYTSAEGQPFRRVQAQILENSIYSKNTVASMLICERTKAGLFFGGWLVLLATREVEIGLAAAAAQVVFGEQLLVRWLRLEWLRARFEETFKSVYLAMQARPNANMRNATSLQAFVEYECAKAAGGAPLSERHFDRTRTESEREWERVRTTLQLQ